MGTAVGRGQTPVATAMASFQRCIGKLERWRQQQRHGEPGKLFYIIPRHNRDNLSVCTHTQRREVATSLWGFFKVHIRNISLDFPEYRFHGKKKKKENLLLVSGSHSQHSQPFLAIIIMKSGGSAGPRHPGN